MKTIFKESHVGQKVNCSMFGNGVIETINLQHRYPVKVLFQGEHYQIGYLQDGRHDSIHYPTLSFGHKEMDNFHSHVYHLVDTLCGSSALGREPLLGAYVAS